MRPSRVLAVHHAAACFVLSYKAAVGKEVLEADANGDLASGAGAR
jgi:hypothetical protein